MLAAQSASPQVLEAFSARLLTQKSVKLHLQGVPSADAAKMSTASGTPDERGESTGGGQLCHLCGILCSIGEHWTTRRGR